MLFLVQKYTHRIHILNDYCAFLSVNYVVLSYIIMQVIAIVLSIHGNLVRGHQNNM
jgi:uncharacterized membrane protein YcgQ (UPF0703/DUF1980 family)